MLSLWIPEENGQQYLSELGASLDAISRQEVRDRHVAVTLEEMGKRSGDPASFTPLLDRQFKDFIERGHDELSTMPTPSRRRRESEFPLLSDDEQTSESDDEADSVSSTQTYKEAQLVRVLTGGVRRNPTRACADLPPGTYALADATLRHILDDSAFDRSEMQKVLLSQNSLSYNDDNHAIEDLYACEGEQLQLYRDSSHRILHAFGPYSQEDRERFVQDPRSTGTRRLHHPLHRMLRHGGNRIVGRLRRVAHATGFHGQRTSRARQGAASVLRLLPTHGPRRMYWKEGHPLGTCYPQLGQTPR